MNLLSRYFQQRARQDKWYFRQAVSAGAKNPAKELSDTNEDPFVSPVLRITYLSDLAAFGPR